MIDFFELAGLIAFIALSFVLVRAMIKSYLK